MIAFFPKFKMFTCPHLGILCHPEVNISRRQPVKKIQHV